MNRLEAKGLSGGNKTLLGRRLVLILGLVLLPGIGSAQTREKVRVALGAISVNTSVNPISQQYGLFAKHGVDIEPYMGGAMSSLAAVTSNSVQFLSAGSTATISA